MEIISKQYLEKYNGEDYVWYACYGSNINYERFMYYINGDTKGKYSTVNGCEDKSEPIEERKYIFECPIYFADNRKRWGGGVAFLDYEHKGKSYGKLYKIKMNQFKWVLKQEQTCELYDTILLIDYIEKLPVFTFTAQHRLDNLLQKPSTQYIEVIKKGLLSLYDNMDSSQIDAYLKNYCETGKQL